MVTDEMVEAVAKALATDQEHIPWAGHRHPDNWTDHARAALAAVLPDHRKQVIEEVAAAVERPDSRLFPGRGWDFQYAAALRRYAEPVTAEPKTAEEKIAFRKDWDRRVEEGKTS